MGGFDPDLQAPVPLQSSAPEDVFAQIFCETFGPEAAQYLVPQYPFQDIYGKGRFIDYALRTDWEQFAFEIDSAIYHAPDAVSLEKWEDDLLRQNSLIHNRWRVFRWTDRQLAQERERVQEELTLYLQGTRFVIRDDYLPMQRGAVVELRGPQQEALASLAELRQQGITIALLAHAQGMGKTVVAVEDARRLNQRTLFLAHRRPLVEQADNAFRQLWPEATVRIFDRAQDIQDATVVVGTIQGVAANLKLFRPDDFGYVVVDEAHHATSETYQRAIGYFRTHFLLGLTATPFRADNASVLQVFQNVAHRMGLEEAIKRGHLVPIRCVRISTNIDMHDVRFNGVKYNTRDLEVRLIVRERDDLIVNTYLDHVPNRRAVAFCVNVRHAESLAEAFRTRGVPAQAVSGGLAAQERKARLSAYHNGQTLVLCACDLLNEGWDSPETEVLLMARPTLSRVVYLQQIGRGTRRSPGKEALIVFDFVDNATMLNRSISLHSLLGKKEYRPGGLILAPDEALEQEQKRIALGEKPEAILSLNLWIKDMELVDIFDWRKEVESMYSAARLSMELGVDPTTVSNWIASGKIRPDLEVPLGSQTYYYFRAERVDDYQHQFGLEKITPETRKEAFMKFVQTMDMATSYKPVLLLSMLELADGRGRVRVSELVSAFRQFYLDRVARGMPAEKSKARMSQVETMTDADVERLMFAMPFERFERHSFFVRVKDVEFVAFAPEVWRRLTEQDKTRLREIAESSLQTYFGQ